MITDYSPSHMVAFDPQISSQTYPFRVTAPSAESQALVSVQRHWSIASAKRRGRSSWQPPQRPPKKAGFRPWKNTGGEGIQPWKNVISPWEMGMYRPFLPTEHGHFLSKFKIRMDSLLPGNVHLCTFRKTLVHQVKNCIHRISQTWKPSILPQSPLGQRRAQV